MFILEHNTAYIYVYQIYNVETSVWFIQQRIDRFELIYFCFAFLCECSRAETDSQPFNCFSITHWLLNTYDALSL